MSKTQFKDLSGGLKTLVVIAWIYFGLTLFYIFLRFILEAMVMAR